MGLDQYANWVDGDHREDFHYWRKCNHIQNWMQKLYASKTGIDSPQDFNCVDVELTEEDIRKFVDDVVNRRLKPVSGFFFGRVDYDPYEYMEDDLEFASKVMKHLWMKRKVVYSSWW